MGPFQDGWLSALAKIVSTILARSDDVDYRALYGGVVLFRDGDKVTVRPDDARLGDSLVCQLRRPDGYSSEPAPGTQCLIGWDGYDPSERYAVMASASGQPATSVSVQAATVNLGDEQGSAVLKQPMQSNLQTFLNALQVWVDATSVATGVPAVTVDAAFVAFKAAAASYTTTKTKAS
jgi:hypothetical protein